MSNNKTLKVLTWLDRCVTRVITENDRDDREPQCCMWRTDSHTCRSIFDGAVHVRDADTQISTNQANSGVLCTDDHPNLVSASRIGLTAPTIEAQILLETAAHKSRVR
jgi:hypothetical protein